MAGGRDNYPVELKGDLSKPPSPALWLIKLLLIIPHLFILVFLWIAFMCVTLVAFLPFYSLEGMPGDIFKPIMGINRCAYRLAAYVALMTDEYPPFRLWE